VSSIIFDSHDFSDFTTCTVEEAAHSVVPTAKAIPGRAGALLLSGRIPPRVLKVKLFLDPHTKPSTSGMSVLRHLVYGWLASTKGATLVVPGDPALEWHDVVCTDAGDWSSLEEDATCELEFTCFDPVAFGEVVAENGTSFEVGGTWPTWPTFELTASAGTYVQVACGNEVVRIEHTFAGGESVVINCGTEAVSIDGADARADVTLASDFFYLEPGERTLAFDGCSAHTVSYRERWL
jgi:phage-related protein